MQLGPYLLGPNDTPENGIYIGDALELIKQIPDQSIDLVLTDPPYPDCYTELYGYKEDIIDWLKEWECRQLIFWSAKVDFPLDYTARHIWDKMTGAACQYDFIYERNGHKSQKVFRGHRINSTVSAQFAKDIFTGHPSQKPIALIIELIEKFSKKGEVVFDPFVGSGTTPTACLVLHRKWLAFEKEPKWTVFARQRVKETELPLFTKQTSLF